MASSFGYIAAAVFAALLSLTSGGPALAGSEPPPLRGTLSPAAPPDPTAPKLADSWSGTEIASARAECESLLKGLGLDFSYLAPIKHGQCGSPQPIELRGLAGNPHVAVVPPATLNCKMAATLAKWFASVVQPLATSQLKVPIILMRNAASYDCRNRYNDPKAKLSEHAKANAIDVMSFTLASGKIIAVGDLWGPTLRGLLEQPSQPKSTKMGISSGFATTVQPASIEPQASQKMSQPTAAEIAAKGHLGSEAIVQARVAEAAKRGIALPKPATPEAEFIHAVHDTACKAFGTVLGPEANDAHKDHFHLDMAVRPGSSYCE